MRTPSKPSILSKLKKAGFNLESIIEQETGRIEIGFLTNGRVEPQDRKRTEQAADEACKILSEAFKTSFSWWGLGYGSCMVQFNYQPNELVWNNMD